MPKLSLARGRSANHPPARWEPPGPGCKAFSASGSPPARRRVLTLKPRPRGPEAPRAAVRGIKYPKRELASIRTAGASASRRTRKRRLRQHRRHYSWRELKEVRDVQEPPDSRGF